MDEQILKLTENLTEEEMDKLFENLKQKIFKGGIKELNPEKREEAIQRYFEHALGA